MLENLIRKVVGVIKFIGLCIITFVLYLICHCNGWI